MKKYLLCVFCALLVLCGCESDEPVVTVTTAAETIATETAAVITTAAETTAIDVAVDKEAYFDNAVFVGDSIMEGIRQYVARTRKTQPTLGNASFVATTIGISLADLVGDKTQPNYYRYNGKEQPIEDILLSIEGVERVFLLLGQNDLVGESEPSLDKVCERYLRLIEKLQTALPYAEIVVMTSPPKVASAWLPSYVENRSFNNSLIDSYVIAVKQMCNENGIACFDMHACLEDENGVLPDEYCRDGYIHLNDEGAKTVVNALYAFADIQGAVE